MKKNADGMEIDRLYDIIFEMPSPFDYEMGIVIAFYQLAKFENLYQINVSNTVTEMLKI